MYPGNASTDDFSDIEASINRLENWIDRKGVAGYDPYDAMRSPFLRTLPFGSRLIKFLIVQTLCRSPINFRPLVGVAKGVNPKSLALLLNAAVEKYRRKPHSTEAIHSLLAMIVGKAVHRNGGCGWGYNFDWPSRSFFIPKDSPNTIVTVFVAKALVNARSTEGVENIDSLLNDACNYLLNATSETNAGRCGDLFFTYVPSDSKLIHNVNLLAASLLAMVYRITGTPHFLDAASRSVRSSLKYQHSDGSWFYGEESHLHWIDSFHTGYNLVALADYIAATDDHSLMEPLAKGFDYYRNTFFSEDGMPRYFHNRDYPIDPHNSAQGILTLCALETTFPGNLDMAVRIARWIIAHMQDHDGYFYFRKTRYWTAKIAYIRWTQAWMSWGLNCLLNRIKS
jgi:hypothetical protein